MPLMATPEADGHDQAPGHRLDDLITAIPIGALRPIRSKPSPALSSGAGRRQAPHECVLRLTTLGSRRRRHPPARPGRSARRRQAPPLPGSRLVGAHSPPRTRPPRRGLLQRSIPASAIGCAGSRPASTSHRAGKELDRLDAKVRWHEVRFPSGRGWAHGEGPENEALNSGRAG
jgi:hypothetical protein